MPEDAEKDKRISPEEVRRRLYGAERDAEIERQEEKKGTESDTRADLYETIPKKSAAQVENETELEKATREEQEELEGRRPE
ncbi:MAG: hypothetical protein Q7S50_00610 [bacterium]|nr:hypothetical protein [bacterium]